MPKVKVIVANIPQEVEEGANTAEAIQQLAANCHLSNFTLTIDGNYVEEGDVIPTDITKEFSGRIALVPYDRAA